MVLLDCCLQPHGKSLLLGHSLYFWRVAYLAFHSGCSLGPCKSAGFRLPTLCRAVGSSWNPAQPSITLSLESPPHMCGSKSPWVWGDLMHRFEAPSAASSFPGHPICISSHTGSPKPHPPASGPGFLLDRLVRILPVRATTTVPGLRAPGFDF